jgi:hypothetical protein
MATKPELQAQQKARKQKIVLAVGGVLLIAVLAMQVPKLLKRSSSTSAAPAATVTTPDGTTVTPPRGASTAVVVSASKNSAQLAGVVIAPAKTPAAAVGQLWSFSRFKAKDPFVPQVSDSNGSSTTTSSSSGGTTTTTGGGSTGTTGGSGTPAAAGPPTYATLVVNGKTQQLTLRQVFPKSDPTFVLAKLSGTAARIGVAGGSFTAGNTMVLQLGKKVTLMNTTTGQRYVVKLVYIGAQPETIAPFKGGAPAPAATGSSATTAVSGTVP